MKFAAFRSGVAVLAGIIYTGTIPEGFHRSRTVQLIALPPQ